MADVMALELVKPKPPVVHVTECRLCGSPDLDLVVSFTPTPPGDQYLTDAIEQPCYPLDVVCCRGCGAVQLADTVDPSLIYPEYLYTTSVSKGLTEHFAQYADDLVRRVPHLRNRLVVDLGSNDGTLLSLIRDRAGCVVLGIEPATAIGQQSPVPTIGAFFSEDLARVIRADEQYGPAQVITANHVMANVADLHDFLKGVKHLLAPSGTFVFETGYWPAIVDGMLIDTIEHEHVHYFAVKPLQQLFTAHGLTLVHVEQNRAKGGSLRGYVQHVGAVPDSSVEAIGKRDDRFNDAHSLELLQENVFDKSEAIRELTASAQGETWVGYGAAVGSTLQLYQFGLGEKLTCLVDVNPQKQGRLSPGFHLPVVSPSELKAMNPDRIVILAWRYAAMIQAQHPEFKGKFLTLLPELTIS